MAIPIGFHIAWNLFEGLVFGFPVSGVDMGTSLIALQVKGPELWTGGPFGPETGLLGIGGHLVGTIFIILWLRYRRGKPFAWDHVLRPSLTKAQPR